MKAAGTKVLALFLLFFACALSFSARVSFADIPKTIQYEGKLVSKGNLAADGTYSMTFSIYDSATGGTALWTETLQVQVTTGVFSALLGNTTPVNLSFDKQYYMGLSVKGEAEMTPRQTLSSAGYSFNADTVDTFHASSTAAANTLLPLNSSAKIPSSVIDTTGATNVVTQIVAGSNVTISPAAGTGAVTISAAGGSGGAGTVTSVATGTGLTGGPVTSTGTLSIASGGVSSTEILDGTIANADISATAAIAKSKLAALSIVNADVDAAAAIAVSKINGLGTLATLNAVGSAEITDSSISFSDMGINGCAAGQIMKYNGAAWACAADATSGGIGVGSISSTEILDGTIVNADISATAAIAQSKIAGGPFIAQTPSSAQTIQSSADVVPLIIKDDAGTTANLLDVQNNAGTSLVKINALGRLHVGNPIATAPKLSVYETGANNNAGYFEINNAASGGTALYGTTNGTGNAIYGYTTGTNKAGFFQVNNAANGSEAVNGVTNGTGRAAWFQIANAANGSAALTGTTNGTGNAGYFWINNAGNAASALYVQTNGTGKFIDASNGAFLSNAGIWTDVSSRKMKQDIVPLTEQQYEESLNKLLKTDVVYFRYKKDPSEVHIGVIAEDAPEEMVDPERKGLYPPDSIGMLLAALKAQQKQIEAQAAEMEILKQKISVLEGK